MPLSTSLAAVLAVLCCAASCALAYPRVQELPRLRIDPEGISCSGLSSGADFSVQFTVAYSKIITGVGVFAGEPYHCAVTRFPNDDIQQCSQQPPNILGPGCLPGSAPCEGCPGNSTLIYDHCKNHPQWVNVSQLVAHTLQAGAAGAIDPPSSLARTRAYLYRGTLDSVYVAGSMETTRDYFAAFATDARQVVLEETIASLHAMPTLDYGSPCGVPGSPPAIENCDYDGAGIALQHIYNTQLAPRAPSAPLDAIRAFDQRPYFAINWTGLADEGYIFVPPACTDLSAVCRLHVVFHGCGQYAANPAMNLSYVEHTGYNQWAATNNIVVLYPQSGGYPSHHRQGGSTQQQSGCWDSYGQELGADGSGVGYDTHAGPQMQTVRSMVQALSGW